MAHATTPSAARHLPQDALYEVLLRMPAKDLCRLRAVCRPWRTLLSDPQFIAAHAARHTMPPLVVTGYHTACRKDGVIFEILDQSGDVVRRVRAAGDDECERVISVHLDFVCTYKDCRRCFRLFNMTTGSVIALPEGFAEEHADGQRDIVVYTSVAAIWQIASTGQYKVLRVLDGPYFHDDPEQLCEVLTLGGSSHGRWRGKKAPPIDVSLRPWGNVVVNGIMYFFGNGSTSIASFDLEREEWRSDLEGPQYEQFLTNAPSMAAVNDSLVVVDCYLNSIMDLWFLIDLERGLWVKQYNIRVQLREYTRTICPLLVLNDGKLVFLHIGSDSSVLKIYNPRTKTFADYAEMELCFAVGLYPRSLLSLASRKIM